MVWQPDWTMSYITSTMAQFSPNLTIVIWNYHCRGGNCRGHPASFSERPESATTFGDHRALASEVPILQRSCIRRVLCQPVTAHTKGLSWSLTHLRSYRVIVQLSHWSSGICQFEVSKRHTEMSNHSARRVSTTPATRDETILLQQLATVAIERLEVR